MQHGNDGPVVDLVSSDDEVNVDSNSVIIVEIIGPPLSMPRPTSIAWMAKGKMRKAVYNQKSKLVLLFRNQFKEKLEVTGHSFFPLYPEGAVAMEITFYRKVAVKNLPQVRKFATNKFIYDTKKPDVDNLSKFVLDALNGVVYKDDDQVVKLTATKVLHTEPSNTGKTVVTFYKIN
jgi:Holliday junction resolvase RusA-like endonuclease